jgi:hypothetical protein
MTRKNKDRLELLYIAILPGLGAPSLATWLLAEVMSSWTPMAVLCLIGLVVLWLAGLTWAGFWTVGYFVVGGSD